MNGKPVIYVPDWAMFCLQWPDGYKNKFPMNPEKYPVVRIKINHMGHTQV